MSVEGSRDATLLSLQCSPKLSVMRRGELSHQAIKLKPLPGISSPIVLDGL
jgi:hypothetical protein